MNVLEMVTTAVRVMFRGGKAYWLWIALLVTLLAWGGAA